MLKILLVIISDAEIGGSSYIAQSAVNIFIINTRRLESALVLPAVERSLCLLPRSAYVCVNLLWWWWAHAFSPHLLLPPTPPTHDAATCRPFFASFAPSAPLGGGEVLEDGCQHMRQGNSWHSITAGRMPRDSNNSEEWTHVLHEVCALRHLLCTSFYASITNFCPFVSHRPHLLRSFCSTEIFIMKETQASLTVFVFLMKKSKAKVKGLSLNPGENEALWIRLWQWLVFLWVTVGGQWAWTPTQVCSASLILLFMKRQECMKWSDQVLAIKSLFNKGKKGFDKWIPATFKCLCQPGCFDGWMNEGCFIRCTCFIPQGKKYTKK